MQYGQVVLPAVKTNRNGSPWFLRQLSTLLPNTPAARFWAWRISYKTDQLAYRVIEPFQKGETATFVKHIQAGLQLLQEQPDSLLVFSGWAYSIIRAEEGCVD